ncbi:MAG: glycosyltransferase family 87 protein [Crocinitomicaceae bacterium]
MILQLKKQYWTYYLWSFGFILVFFIAEILNHRFWLNDFKVYYLSSFDFLEGKSIYENTYGLGSGWFKYSPFFAMLFSIFTLMSYKVASLVFYWIIGVSILVFLPLIGEKSKGERHLMWVLPIVFLFIADHLVRELHLGNVNMILLSLSFLLFALHQKGNSWIGCFVFTLIIVLKPYFMLLGLYFLLKKEWKWIGVTAFFTLVFLLLPSLVVGFTENIDLLKGWGRAMSNHNAEITSYNYLSGTIEKYFSVHISIFVFIGLFELTYLVLFIKKFLKDDYLSFFLLIAIIPNLVLTDTEHFLYSIPLLIYFFKNIEVKLELISVIGLIGCVLYGLNWGFFWGSKTGDVVTSGIIGIGNLLLIVSVLMMASKQQQISK